MLSRKTFSRKAMQNRMRLLVALLIAALANFAGKTSGAKEDTPYEWSDVSRIVAIGDIHGAYHNFVAVLENAGLVDEKLRWIGGRAHLVQMGDVVDRGHDSRRCLELLMALEKQAKRAGGRVHVLIANHEAMNLVGLLDYVSDGEFASFADSNSARLRQRVFEHHYKEQKERAKGEGEPAPPKDEARKAFESEYPLGYFERRLAFRPEGRYGGWILSHNAAVRINGIVFSHGDWSEEISALGIQELNGRVRDELSGKAALENGITFHLKSPIQYRGLAQVPLERETQEAYQEKVDRILTNLGASRMVVGHTVTEGRH